MTQLVKQRRRVLPGMPISTSWRSLEMSMATSKVGAHGHDLSAALLPDVLRRPVRRAAEEPEHDHLPTYALRHDL
ncbi:hypothetical protein [Roseovarius nitratireducens]|uniref:hypothetical protein n=1 Tax=Roseovarius nitratireducens TaxID=2044597 RepID=UPI0019816C96|nr:hypothetical protein [Roseovarius nitratireducens]